MENLAHSDVPLEQTARYLIQDLARNPKSKFAVFCRSTSAWRAKFKSVHPSVEVALDVARLHAAEYASTGKTDFTYYVVEIKHRVGIENGKIVDEAVA